MNKTNRLSLKETIEYYKDGDRFNTYIDDDSYSPPIVRLTNNDLIIEGSSYDNENGKSIREIMTLHGLALMTFEYIGDYYKR